MNDYEVDPPDPLYKKLMDIGRAQQILSDLLKDEIWDDLSKHNPWWESQHAVEDDKLHTARSKLSYFNTLLWDIYDKIGG